MRPAQNGEGGIRKFEPRYWLLSLTTLPRSFAPLPLCSGRLKLHFRHAVPSISRRVTPRPGVLAESNQLVVGQAFQFAAE